MPKVRSDRDVITDFYQLRRRLNWSQNAAAKKLEISQGLLSEIENHNRKPSEKILQKMAYLVITRTQQFSAL